MATIYDNNSNCLECGRLVAPTSGMRSGIDDENVFCCRKCLRSYYDAYPGSWESEIKLKLELEECRELHRLEEEENNLKALDEQKKLDEQNKRKEIRDKFELAIFYTICFVIFLILLRSCH
jgi:hypothetical protein